MAAKTKAEDKQPEAQPLPDVLTVSQHAQLSDDEKQAFRARNGTVTNDPI